MDASKTKLFEGVVEVVDLTEFPASGVPITLPPNEKPFVGTVGGPSGLGLGCAAAGADPNEKPANGAGLDAVAEEFVGRLGCAAWPKEKVGAADAVDAAGSALLETG